MDEPEVVAEKAAACGVKLVPCESTSNTRSPLCDRDPRHPGRLSLRDRGIHVLFLLHQPDHNMLQ